MFSTIVEKELKHILLSPKFTATFAVCSLLILLSVYVGIQEYRSAVAQYETATRLTEERARQATSWMGFSMEAFRKPDPMQIIAAGVTNDIGRFSSVNPHDPIKLRNSAYSDDPIFALFRSIDLAFIVQVVLTLFAILFSYDAINGERESGTLQLTFAGSVPRVVFIAAKFVGSWIGLVAPLMIPFALGALLLLLFNVPFTPSHWARFAMVLGASLLLFTFFLALGIFISAVTRRSSVSFLLALALWVAMVLILPRAAIMSAGQIILVPSVAEVEGQRDSYAKDAWERHMSEMTERWRTREAPTSGLSRDERETYRDAHMWEWMQQDDASRTAMQKEIEEYGTRLNEELRNKRAEQEGLALTLSRFSPASAFQLAVIGLAGTDIGLKTRYEDAMSEYRSRFNQFREQKQKQSGNPVGIRITMDSDKGFQFTAPREQGALDLAELPRFQEPEFDLGAVLPSILINLAVLVGYAVLAVAGAFLAFLKFDLR